MKSDLLAEVLLSSSGRAGAWADVSPMPSALIARAERQLAKDGAQVERTVINAAPDGVMLVAQDGRILLANPAMAQLSGHTPEALVGELVEIFLPPAMRQMHAARVRQFFTAPRERGMGQLGPMGLCRKDGSTVAVDVSLGQAQILGQPCAVVFVRDMTEVRRLEARMRHQATHDHLTGLANRWMFGHLLAQAMAQSRRSGRPLAVLLMDLDDFKAVNDGHGHAAGDLVLQEVARRLKATLRAEDTLARLGGDEFAALLRDLPNPDDAVGVARKLIAVLSDSYRVHGYEVFPGASVGVVFFPDDAQDAETLLRYADMAMYQAKGSGRGTCTTYAGHMSYKVDEQLLLHTRLKHALTQGELALHYQPQVDVMSGQVVGVEALLRWTDAELGDVPPSRFIAVAESTGLILPLGDWVLETACRQIGAWAAQGQPLRVAVNLSAQQFRQKQLVERLADCLSRHAVPPALLELEITESQAMGDAEQAHETLRRLSALGVGIALDDFGTGHSSLAYLQRLPVSRIKIDRSFIQPVPHSGSDATLVRAISTLAGILGLDVVVEGVEKTEQLDFVRGLGCQVYQGWLFAKALPAAALMARLAQPLNSAVARPPHPSCAPPGSR